MSRPTSTWKKVEGAIARWFPEGRRRGADFRGENGGKTDVVSPGWAVEVKHGRRPTYGLMKSAVAQAERNRAKPDDIPVAVIHKVGEEYKDSLVVMRLEEFAKFFINE